MTTTLSNSNGFPVPQANNLSRIGEVALFVASTRRGESGNDDGRARYSLTAIGGCAAGSQERMRPRAKRRGAPAE